MRINRRMTAKTGDINVFKLVLKTLKHLCCYKRLLTLFKVGSPKLTITILTQITSTLLWTLAGK